MNEMSSCVGLSLRRTIERKDLGVARGVVFQEIQPGASFKTGNFVKEELGGLPLKTTLQKS